MSNFKANKPMKLKADARQLEPYPSLRLARWILQLDLLGLTPGSATGQLHALGRLFNLSVTKVISFEERHNNSIYFIGFVVRIRWINSCKESTRAMLGNCSNVWYYYFDADQWSLQSGPLFLNRGEFSCAVLITFALLFLTAALGGRQILLSRFHWWGNGEEGRISFQVLEWRAKAGVRLSGPSAMKPQWQRSSHASHPWCHLSLEPWGAPMRSSAVLDLLKIQAQSLSETHFRPQQCCARSPATIALFWPFSMYSIISVTFNGFPLLHCAKPDWQLLGWLLCSPRELK